MIVTTTNIIQGAEIQKYLGVVSANEVIGIDVVSKWLGSITSDAGGRSGAFRRNLEQLNGMVSNTLTQKAIRLGANAVVGYSVNMSEISGKDMLMIMATATGTAVKISQESLDSLSVKQNNTSTISSTTTYRKASSFNPETNYIDKSSMEYYRKKWAK